MSVDNDENRKRLLDVLGRMRALGRKMPPAETPGDSIITTTLGLLGAVYEELGLRCLDSYLTIRIVGRLHRRTPHADEIMAMVEEAQVWLRELLRAGEDAKDHSGGRSTQRTK